MENIVIATGHFPPVSGGVSDYSQIIASEISKLGYRVFVLTTGHSDFNEANVEILPILSDYEKAITAIRRIKPLTVNLQYTPFIYSKRGFNLHLIPFIHGARKYSSSFITTFHETFNEFNFLRPYYLPLSAVQYASFLAISVLSDLCIVSVDYYKQIAPVMLKSRFRVIPVGSNIFMGESIDRKQSIDGKFVISTFGAFFHPYRRFDVMLKSISLLPEHVKKNLKFRCIGEIGSHPTFRGLITEFNLGDVAEITGRLTGEVVYNKLCESDLFILFEYVRGGRNGIGFRNGSFIAALSASVPSLVNSGKHSDKDVKRLCFTVDKLDPNLIAQMITQIYEDRDRLNERGRFIGDYYKRHLSWNVIICKLLSAINEVSGVSVARP
ncbi:MAG: glycosyltransferase [Planctomycetes bacterium]|nr:glycosyltransferase [Planctomycetota bacterium]